MWVKESWFLFLQSFGENYIHNKNDPWNLENFNSWMPKEYQKNSKIQTSQQENSWNDIHFIYQKEEYFSKYTSAEISQKKWDCSPIYLTNYKVVIPAIFELIDNPLEIKFVFILRNPLDAAISLYRMYFALWWEKRTFEEAIRWELELDLPDGFPYLSTYLHSDWLNAYLTAFGDNVRYYLFDDLNTDFFLDSVCDFLQIKKHSIFFCHENKITDYAINYRLQNLLKHTNVHPELKAFLEKKNSRNVIQVELDVDLRVRLLDFFNEDIKKLHAICEDERILTWLK